MKKLLFVFLFISFITKAQLGKEAWHWQFGKNCAIDFSSGTPVAGFSPLNTLEGCASISDPNTGQLLFYTNGVLVYNKNNQIMYNGVLLMGNQSTTQSALIVSKPGSNVIYYIITVDQAGTNNNKGVHYSIVDISLNGGLGEVTSRNLVLTPPPTGERVVGVKHCNGINYWVITHSYLSDAFNAYLVTSSGINTTPIVSHVGTFLQDTLSQYWWDGGYLKASPNGKKIALVEGNSLNFLEIYDFDNSAGIITNPIKINYIPISKNLDIYGASFSPDNSKLYVATDSNLIYQYDLSSNNTATIIASQTAIGDVFVDTLYNGALGAMQIGPDGKIYVVRYNIDSLAVINNPNNLGAACNFQIDGLRLLANTSGQIGLPNFIDANYQGVQLNLGNDTTFCVGNVPLNAFNTSCTYIWSTGQTTPTITATKATTYWVQVTNEYNCTFHDTLVVHPETSIFNFKMPNIVTPNNDNINDEIDFGKYNFSDLQIEIYDRWGLKVFESSNPNCIWKPNANDVDGIYFTNLQYRIDCGDNSQTKSIKEFVTLIK